MGDELTNFIRRLPHWFRSFCKWLWGKRLVTCLVTLWTLIILPLLVNIASSFMTTPYSNQNFQQAPLIHVFIQLFDDPRNIAIIILILLLLTMLMYFGSHDNVGVAGEQKEHKAVDKKEGGLSRLDKKLKQSYLEYMVEKTRSFKFNSVVASFQPKSVQLADIFVPLWFQPALVPPSNAMPSEEMDEWRRFEQEKKNQRVLNRGDNKDIRNIKGLWHELTLNEHAVVIQGFAGMGKSTLMARLALHVARLSLNEADPQMSPALEPLIPIFLDLGDYAHAIENSKSRSLSLMDYLVQAHEKHRLGISRVAQFLQKCLKAHCCLVLFDGLDEVGQQMRKQVQESIKEFISQCNSSSTKDNFNRFLITSRVAGYNQEAFSNYPHYRITALTAEQIHYFWRQWYVATEAAEPGETYRVPAKFKEHIDEINDAQGIPILAENPLLLTLLAVMKQKDIKLPRQRVELYSHIIRTLLENPNGTENLPAISESQAISRLGPLAFEMQQRDHSFLPRKDVLRLLKQAIQEAGSTASHPEQEAQNFLNHLCTHKGLFVLHTGDYYGFLHRTFQEYFAAHYLLNRIKDNPIPDEITKLVTSEAHPSNALWREPWLFAVGYLGYQNRNDRKDGMAASSLAQRILIALLNASQDPEDREHNLLLATECLIEAKPTVIDATLEQRIASSLLNVYAEKLHIVRELLNFEGEKRRIQEIDQQIARELLRIYAEKRPNQQIDQRVDIELLRICVEELRNQQIDICEHIERAIRRWLLNLTGEKSSPLLRVLRETLNNTGNIVHQRATLTMLVMLAKQLDSCPPIVFEWLIPPLMKLAGLEDEQNSNAISPILPDLTVADLAFTVLSFMGKKGPAGSLLEEVKQYFKSNPRHLDILATYSLESQTLLTPVVVPQTQQKYKGYLEAVQDWLTLSARRRRNPTSITNNDTQECSDIHRKLLDNAEEVRYPTTRHFLNILQSSDRSYKSWQSICQTYLTSQLAAGFYMNFQEVILLWTFLFPQEALVQLITLLLEHYESGNTQVQRYTRHFLATFSKNYHIQQDWRYVRDIIDMLDLSELRDLQSELRANQDEIQDQDIEKYWKENRFVPERWQDLRSFQYLQKHRKYRSGSKLPNLQELYDLLFTPEMVKTTCKYLTPSNLATDPQQYLDLFSILRGFVFLFEDELFMRDAVEEAITVIIETASVCFTSTTNNEVRAIILDIIRNLPTRSEEGIEIVSQLEKKTNEEQIRQACTDALKQASPYGPEAQVALEVALSQIA